MSRVGGRIGSPRVREAIALALCLGLLVLWGWVNRNLVDDAFIGFRYAENFAQGHGLVWNPGERTEGFTSSFLWVPILGLAMMAGFPPIPATFALNLLFLLIALWLFYFVARRVLGSPGHALLATALVGTNYTFSASGTLGIGTHLQTLFLLASLLVLMRLAEAPGHRVLVRLALFSLLCATAVLVRMDSLLPVGILGLAALALLRREIGGAETVAARLAALFAPGGIVLGAWLLWKWSTYGDVLPATFYIKVPGEAALWAGLYYVYAFLLSYLFIVQIPVVLTAAWQLRLRRDWPIVVALAIVLAWFGYMVRIGGDFIEFRFLAVIVPFLILVIYWSILRVSDRPVVRGALLALVAAGSLQHQLAFGRVIYANCIYRPSLAILEVPPPSANNAMLWSELEIARYLTDAFGNDRDLRIALGQAGVIPYYTKFWTLDLLGLSDPWIGKNGLPLRFERYVGGLLPGATRIAPIGYATSRGVHLYFGTGALTRDDHAHSVQTISGLMTEMFFDDPNVAKYVQARLADFPPDASVVEIPVRPGYELLAIYLNRNEHVDRVIAARGWRTYPIRSLRDE